VVALTSTFVTWRVYGILRILRKAHVSNASMREHWSFVVDHVSHPYDKTGTMYTCPVSIYNSVAKSTLYTCIVSSHVTADITGKY